MTVTNTCRLVDNIIVVRDALWVLSTPMQTIQHTSPFADEGHDDLIRRMLQIRENLTGMLSQIDASMMSVEATKAAALAPAERKARVELVAQAQKARAASELDAAARQAAPHLREVA